MADITYIRLQEEFVFHSMGPSSVPIQWTEQAVPESSIVRRCQKVAQAAKKDNSKEKRFQINGGGLRLRHNRQLNDTTTSGIWPVVRGLELSRRA